AFRTCPVLGRFGDRIRSLVRLGGYHVTTFRVREPVSFGPLRPRQIIPAARSVPPPPAGRRSGSPSRRPRPAAPISAPTGRTAPAQARDRARRRERRNRDRPARCGGKN